VRGRPLFFWSVRAFERCRTVAGYVLVVNPDRVARVEALCRLWRLRRLLAVAPGGPERTDSAASGLRCLPKQGLVAVHDGARPLITPEMLSAGFRECARHGPTLFASPVTDTLKLAVRGRVSRTVDRNGLFSVQTPQFFPLALLRRAFRTTKLPRTRATDDAMLVERLGIKPRLLITSRLNIKVTTREDLALCRRLL
jgi:2-C-methyl-D-erythritol 4-phosphate cytidylyltransferase